MSKGFAEWKTKKGQDEQPQRGSTLSFEEYKAAREKGMTEDSIVQTYHPPERMTGKQRAAWNADVIGNNKLAAIAGRGTDGYLRQLQNEDWNSRTYDRSYRQGLGQQIQEADRLLGTLKEGSTAYDNTKQYADYLRALQGAFTDREAYFSQFQNEDEYKLVKGVQAAQAKALQNGESYNDYYQRTAKGAERANQAYQAALQRKKQMQQDVNNQRRFFASTGILQVDGQILRGKTAEDYLQQMQDKVNSFDSDPEIQQLARDVQRTQQVASYAKATRWGDLERNGDFYASVREGMAKVDAKWSEIKSKRGKRIDEANWGNPETAGVNDVGVGSEDWYTWRMPRDDWTQAEVDRFAYLFNRDENDAYDYALELNQQKQAQLRNDRTGAAAGWAYDNPVRGAVTGAAAKVATSPLGLWDFASDIVQYANTGTVMPRGELSPRDYANAFAGGAANRLNDLGTLPENWAVIGGKGAGDLYQLANSVLESIAWGKVSRGIVAIGGEKMGALASAVVNLGFFGNAASETTQQAIMSGKTPQQALLLGFANGAAEALGETLSVEHLVHLPDATGLRSTVRNLLAQGGIEASEEAMTTLINTFSDALIMGDKSELQQAIRENMSNGMDYETAVRTAWKRWANDLAFDALGGFLSGAASGGLETVVRPAAISTIRGAQAYSGGIQTRGMSKEERQELRRTTAQEVINYGRLADEGTKARSMADKAQERLDKKGSITNRQAARLSNETAKAIRSADRTTLEDAVKARLQQTGEMSAADLDRTAKSIVDRVTGDKVEGDWTNDQERQVYTELEAQLSGVSSENWMQADKLKTNQAREQKMQSIRNLELKGSGKTVKVTHAEMKDGKLAFVYMENGKEKVASQEDLKLDTAQEDTLKMLTQILGEDAAAAYNTMNVGTMAFGDVFDVMRYASAFATVRDVFGATGVSEERMLASPLRNGLTNGQALQAWTIGKNRGAELRTEQKQSKAGTGKVSLDGVTIRHSDGKTTTYKAVKDQEKARESKKFQVVQAIAKSLKIDMVLYDGEGGQQLGMYGNGVIYLDWTALQSGDEQSADWVVFRTLSHELTHFIQQNAKKEYQELRGYITKYLSESKNLDFNDLVAQKMAREYDPETGKLMSYDKAVDEVMADACETMLRDSQYVQELMQENQSLWEKIRSFIRNFLAKIEASDTAAKELQPVIQELREIWDRGLKTAVESRDGTAIAPSTENRQAVEKLSDGGQKIVESLGKDAEIQVNKDGEMEVAKSADGNTMAFSVKTYEDGGKDKLIRELKKNGHTQEEIDAVIENIEATGDFLEKLAQQYAESSGYENLRRNLYATISTNLKTGKQVISTLVNNGDYPINLDLQLICKKRVAYMRMLTRLIDDGVFDKVDFKGSAIADLNKILRDGGFETACLGCFVESRRLQLQAWAETIVEEWNAAVDAREENAGSFNFAEGGNALSQMEIAGLITELEGAGKKNDKGNLNLGQGAVAEKMGRLLDKVPSLRQHLTVADLLTPKGMSMLRTYDQNLFSLVKQRYGAASPKIVQDFNPYNGEIADLSFKFVKDMIGETVSGAQDYKTQVRKELKKNKGESASDFTKRVEEEALRRYLYDIGGVRIQSFSDFMIENVFDYVQIIADLSAREMPLHGYSKEAIFLRLFGMTGGKFNGSLIAHVEESMGKEYAGLLPAEEASNGRGIVVEVDGKKYAICVDDYARHAATGSFVQSIGLKDIVALQMDPRYSKNVGSITIGVSDKQILAMLDSPYFRMVIPYHASGMLPEFAKLVGVNLYNDYTNYQTTRVNKRFDLNGNPVDKFYKANGKELEVDTHYDYNAEVQRTGDARKAASNYLAWCQERHPVYEGKKNGKKVLVGYATFTPKFNDSPYGTDFTQHPNYYKLLEDFNVYDSLGEASAMQGAVTMTLPSEATRLTPEQMTAYKQALRDTGLYTEKEIAKYAKKADMTFQELIAEEVGNRADYESRQAKVWDETVDKAEKMLLEKYGREGNKKAAVAGDKRIEAATVDESILQMSAKDFGLEEYDKESRNNIKMRGGIIVTDVADLLRHVNIALSSDVKKNLSLGALDDSTRKQIEAEIGHPVFTKKGQYGYTISYDDIRHIEKHYSSPSDIVDTVITLCGIVKDHDAIREEIVLDKSGNGKQVRLVMEKTLPNADYLTVNIVSKNSRALDLVTIYITKKNRSQSNQPAGSNVPAGSQLGSTSNNNIAQTAGNSNTKSQDQQYLDAVNNGDMKTAQQMVDAAAKAAGYSVKVYHGTPASMQSATKGHVTGDAYKRLETDYEDKLFPFVVFRDGSASHSGIYTATDRGVASEFKFNFSDTGTVFDLYARTDNPLEIDAGGKGWNNIPRAIADKVGMKDADIKSSRVTLDDVAKFAKKNGYDSVICRNVRETGSGDDTSPITTDVIVFSPNQVKSADPVTYDDNGEVIPLDQRFNVDEDDIRYSTRGNLTSKEAIDAEIDHLQDQIAESYSREGDMRNDPEYRAAQDRLNMADTFKEKVEARRALNAAKNRLGMADLVARRNELAEEINRLKDLRKKYLSVTPISESDYRKLKKHFGTTEDWNVAGFILKDGSSLDFSGKKQYKDYAGGREIYHNEIGDVIGMPKDTSPRINMLNNGNIRLVPETNGINLATMPTAEQIVALRDYIDHNNGAVTVDIDDVGGDTIESFNYYKGTSSSKVISDIRSYFNTGNVPAPVSDLRAFYSVRSDNRTDRELLRDLYERTVAKERARAEKREKNLRDDLRQKSYEEKLTLSDRIEAKADERAKRNEAGLNKAYQKMVRDKQSVIEELKAEQRKALETFLKRQERYDGAMRAVSIEMTKLENLVNAGANQKAISEQRAKVTAAETRLANATAALTQARDSEAIQKILSRERQMQQTRTRNTIRESVNSREMKRRVTRAAGELYEMLATNSDKLHVPEILKEPLGDFLQSLDFTSKRALAGGEETKADQRFGARLQQIRNILENQQRYLNGEEAAAQDLGGYLDISEDSLQFLRDCTDMINQALAENRGYTINQMNAEQLRDLANFLANLKSAIRKMNSFMANERYASVREAADADITEMEAMGRARNLAENRALNEFLWKNGTPYYIFKRMGAGAESIFQGFAKGWSQMAFDAKRIIDFTEQAYTDKEVKQWKKETHDFTLEDGSKITMTTAQIMELSQLLGRQQAVQHLQAGGMRIGDIQTRTGAKGDTRHYHLTDGDLQQILGALSERQMKVARGLQHFMAEQGAEWGNEVSMKRFGYRFYTEGEGYYPIVTDALDRPMADTDAQKNSMFRLLNLSSSKSLNPKANNALVVGDIFNTFTDHMADMAKLHGMGLPILDAIKWYNFKEKTKNEDGTIDTRTLQGAMEQAFGSAAGSYFRTMMKDINGQTENGDRGTGLANMAMGAYKAQAVAANLRVALLQPTAYLRAATVLKPKYMLAAFGNFKASVFAVRAAEAAWKEAMEHSGEMIWKDIGGYDTDLSRSMRSQIQHSDSVKDKVVNGSMFLAEWGDKLTWGRLWAACKLQAKAENKALTGQALMEATEKLFREVIYSSQVMDSTLTRSELMRGKTMGSKILTAFMAEPTLSVNIVMDAASEYHNDTRKYGKAEAWKRNGKRIGKAFMIYLCTQTAAALVESLADAIRDDDDEEYWKKYLEALLGKDNAKRILGEELGKDAKSVFWSAYADGNLLQDYLFLNKLPFIKDLASLLTGFKSRNMMTEGAENLLNVYKIWRETKQLADGVLDKATSVTYYGKMTPWGKIYKSLQAVSQLSGTPLYGASRDVVAIWNTIMNGRKDEWKIRTYDPNALSQSKLNKFNELVAPTGVTKKDFQRITQEIDTDGNGSVSQAEVGPYLQAEEAAGRLTREQAAAVWSATTTGKATYEEWLGKQKLGKYGRGNIDLTDRDTGLYDSSGKLMTVKSISFEEDGQEILIPTIVKKNGKWVELSDDEAIDWYHKTGEYLGKFDSVSEANEYAQRLHLEQEKMYK